MDRQDILNAMDALGGSIDIDPTLDMDGNKLETPLTQDEVIERFVDIVMSHKEKK